MDNLSKNSRNSRNSKEKYENIKQIENIKLDKNKQDLLKLMKITHNVFEKKNIWYCICFGTLLGAVRHWSFVPWDDDIDIFILREQVDKVLELKDELAKYNVRVENVKKLIRFWYNDSFMDLFSIGDVNGKCYRCLTINNDKCDYPAKKKINNYDWWHDWFGNPMDHVLARKKIMFHGLEVYGPSEPNKLLQFWYGDKYLKTCKTHFLDHKTGKMIKQKDISCGELPLPQL